MRDLRSVPMTFTFLLEATSCRMIDTVHVIKLTEQAVAWLIETLCYKPEGRGFDSRRAQGIFQLT
jgi:hypothetical protein